MESAEQGKHERLEEARAARLVLDYAALILANLAMASGPWLVRLADVAPIASGFWRLALAVPVLFILTRCLRQRIPSMSRGMVASLALAGLLFAANVATWHIGIQHTKLGNAALLGNLASFMLAGYFLFAVGRKPEIGQMIAMLLAGGGAFLLVGQSYETSGHHMTGDLLCIVAGVFYTGYMVAMSRARGLLQPIPALFVSTAAGSLPLLAMALLDGRAIWPLNWWPVVLLSMGCQVIGQGLMVYALGRLPPLSVAVALLIQPLFGMMIGSVRYGEAFGMADIAGSVAIGLAIILIRTGGPKPARG